MILKNRVPKAPFDYSRYTMLPSLPLMVAFAFCASNLAYAQTSDGETEFITSPSALEKSIDSEMTQALADFERAKEDLQKQLQELERERRELAKKQAELEQEKQDISKSSAIKVKSQSYVDVPVQEVTEIQPDAAAKNPGEITPLRQYTRLRVDGKPSLSWQGAELNEINCTIKNIGSYAAEGIQVTAALPGGKEIILTGPTTIEPYKKAQYKNNKSETLSSAGEVRVNPTCNNCWR